MRSPMAVCRKGNHPMTGANLLWHPRYKDGEKYMVRECRTCANERYRANRKAAKRNQALDALAKAS